MKQAEIFMYNKLAGMLTEDENGFTFQYNSDYLNSEDSEAISLTMPLKSESYKDKVLFPFIDGLIPEGWLLDIAERSWNQSKRQNVFIVGLL